MPVYNNNDRRANYRGQDGLNKAERQSLKDQHSYEVVELNACHFIASSKVAFADFDVVLAYGRFVRIKSNTGSIHDMEVGGECGCMDKFAHGAPTCKHEAALGAVLEYRASQGEQSIRRLAKAA